MADDFRVNFIRQLWALVLASLILAPFTATALGKQYATFLKPNQSARVYLNPNTGRFWTMDSYEGNNEDPLSLHKYLYGADNPVDKIDPSGHDGGDAVAVAYLAAFVQIAKSIQQAINLSSEKVVNVDVSPDGMPLRFDAHAVEQLLQSQLSAKVFNNLVYGGVLINVAVGVTPAALGWDDNKSTYTCHVTWGKGVLPIRAIALSDRNGSTIIDTEHVNEWYSIYASGDISSQCWVNILAHEVIWLNACRYHDPTWFTEAPPEGDIHSGTMNPFDPFTVSSKSRLDILRKFEFDSSN